MFKAIRDYSEPVSTSNPVIWSLRNSDSFCRAIYGNITYNTSSGFDTSSDSTTDSMHFPHPYRIKDRNIGIPITKYNENESRYKFIDQVLEKEYRINALIDECNNLKNLKKGWDSYDADPPNDKSIQNAQCFLKVLEIDLLLPYPTKVTPTVEGGIEIAFLSDTKYLGIEFYNTGEVTIGTVNEAGDIEVEEFVFKCGDSDRILRIISGFFQA